MSVKYVTVWYPTIFHAELTRKNHTPLFRDIDDSIGDGGKHLRIQISIDDTTENLKVFLKIGKREKLWLLLFNERFVSERTFGVDLVKTKKCHNGFVQYRFDTKQIPNNFPVDKFEKILEREIYHLAKDLYHEHEAYPKEPNRDSALLARITDRSMPVKGADNQFLIGFLKDYAVIFEDYANNISRINKKVQEREDAVDEIKRLWYVRLFSPYKIRNQRREINILSRYLTRECENALIEYTYCKTLLGSKYNKSFSHIYNGIDTPKANDLRRKALNIRNSIRYIENIKYKIKNRQNQTTLRYIRNSDARGTFLAAMSIILAVISVGFTVADRLSESITLIFNKALKAENPTIKSIFDKIPNTEGFLSENTARDTLHIIFAVVALLLILGFFIRHRLKKRI